MKLVGRLKRVNALSASLCFLIIVWGVSLVGCGGSRNKGQTPSDRDNDVNIDQLLGIENENPAPKKNSDEEDEVLRLLGITKDSTNQSQTMSTNPASANTASSAQNPQIDELSQNVQRLEKELSEKEKIISDLRSNLQDKDKKLEELQTATTTMRKGTPASTASDSYTERYQAALTLYNNRRYHEAIQAFSALLNENANNRLADNCQYWIGESYYGLGNYTQSVAEFEKVFAYPNSNKVDAALMKLGITYLKLGDRESAKAQFEQLVANYPKSEYVEKARAYLNRL